MLHESTRAYVIINVSGAFSACFYEIALVFLVCRIPHSRNLLVSISMDIKVYQCDRY